MSTPKGRPAGREYTTTVQVRMADDMVALVDDFRRDEPDLPSRSEAIRRLIEKALDVQDKKS